MTDRGQSTLFSTLFSPAREQVELSALRLAIEAFVYTVVSVFLLRYLAPQQSGLLGVLLAAMALGRRFDDILAENSQRIHVLKKRGWQTNPRTAFQVLSLFFGVMVAFVVISAILGERQVGEMFAFTLEAAGLSDDTIATRNFGSFAALLAHNGVVLGSFVLLTFVYRAHGAVVAVCWNACVWGIVLTLLVQRGAADGVANPIRLVVVAILATLPHVFLEAVAYLLCSLGAIFISKAITNYSLRDPFLHRVARASGYFVLIGGVSLVAAAFVESTYAPWMLGLATP